MSELMGCFFFQPTKQGAAHQGGLSPLPANSTAKQLFHPPFLYVMCRNSAQWGDLPRTGPCARPSHSPASHPVPAKTEKPVLPARSFAVAPRCRMLRGCCSRAGPRALQGAKAAGERAGSTAGAVVVHLGREMGCLGEHAVINQLVLGFCCFGLFLYSVPMHNPVN